MPVAIRENLQLRAEKVGSQRPFFPRSARMPKRGHQRPCNASGRLRFGANEAQLTPRQGATWQKTENNGRFVNGQLQPRSQEQFSLVAKGNLTSSRAARRFLGGGITTATVSVALRLDGGGCPDLAIERTASDKHLIVEPRTGGPERPLIRGESDGDSEGDC